jgi:hypothetical protein
MKLDGGIRAKWGGALRRVSSGPLEFCPGFPEVAERWEAWWRFEADRPLLVGSVAARPGIPWGKAFDLFERPDEWLAVRRRQLEGTYWLDQAVPHIRVDLGPVATAAFLGAPVHFAVKESTVWQTPILDDLAGDAAFRLRPDNRWFRAVRELARRTALDAAGRYAVSMPDFSGAVDVLANLRGTERLLTDLYDNAAAVRDAAARLMDAWDEAFCGFCEEVTAAGAGLTTWVMAWSDVPYTLPTCDFNFMISPGQFREFCLPSLAEQARRAGRCVLHVDGPGASVHAPAIAGEPAITAVQYTPGAGTPSALAKLDMLKALQGAGKPLVVACPKEEVPALAGRLDPRGLALCPENLRTVGEAEALRKAVGA